MMASKEGHVEVVDRLLLHGASVDLQIKVTSCAPMHSKYFLLSHHIIITDYYTISELFLLSSYSIYNSSYGVHETLRNGKIHTILKL